MKKLLPTIAGIILAGIMALSPFFADAQIIPSIPYTLTNGSLADATQVMGNFNTIVTDTNANAATNGANTNITSITGLTTPLANTYGGTVIYTGGTTGGSANAQTLAAVVPSNFALTAGNMVTGIAGYTNTGATTLNVNTQGVTAVKKESPAGLVALGGGEIYVGQAYLFYYDGTEFVLMNSASGITNSQLAVMNADTFKANITSGSATPTDVTYASVAIALNIPITIHRQEFTSSSSTYTPCTGLIYDDMEVVGGGGGGGGTAASTTGSTGAGGGAGGYAKLHAMASTIIAAQPITVTIGAGGTAGSTSGGTGGTGGTSSIGSLITATGGAGGTNGNSSAMQNLGGLGGIGSSGDINARGQFGLSGSPGAFSGGGGSTIFGGGGIPISSNGAGTNGAANTGGGASGAIANNTTAAAGGVGGSGYAVITEYCNQ